MNQFFTYQFISDTIKDMETGHYIVDMMLKASLPLYLVLTSDMRYLNYVKQKLQIISDITPNCYKCKIELKLCSYHESNYEGGYNSCSEDMQAIIYDINDLIYIESESIKKNAIKKYEEIIINETDGYGDNINLVVPIGSITINNIIIKVNIVTESFEHKNNGRKEFRRVILYLYSDTKNNIVNYIDETKEKFSKNLNKESNKCIKWCRLRQNTSSNRDDGKSNLTYFSKELQHKSSFDDLFFKGKKEFIQKVDDFFNGKTSKICLLLHGPPGGGKDSLLVALTKYLSELSKKNQVEKHYDLYHIVSGSIDLLNNDDSFMRFMFGNDKIDGKVIEHNRQVKLIPEVEKYLPQILLKDELIEQCKNVSKEADSQTKMMEMLSNSTMSTSDDFKNIDVKGMITAASENKQKLKKATIIECLDSFMNQNGTICIFTTNLPIDTIDPVLIRDGRLEPFEMGYSSFEVTNEIFSTKYSKTIIDKNIGVNEDFGINHGKIMPSTISRYLNECSSLEETIEKLQNL